MLVNWCYVTNEINCLNWPFLIGRFSLFCTHACNRLPLIFKLNL